MPHAKITAVGNYLPEERLTNADLEQMVDTNDEWIRTRTGIVERRILKDENKATAYMSAAAANEALDKRGISADELDLIIIATVTPDMLFPATAALVQDAIGASNAWGYDVSAACSGFLFALSSGARYIESGHHEKVLVIGADKMSSIVDYEDRNTCILFGDGAGAVLLEADNNGFGILDDIHHIDGSHGDLLCMPGGGSQRPASHETVDNKDHFLKQEGRAVFKFAVERMASAAEEVMVANDLKGEDIAYLVPHQANLRIIDATARRMGVTRDKVMINIDRYGNTTAATIPLCLHDWESELTKGDNLILAAFGGGFTWGATYVKWAYDGADVARSNLAEVSATLG